MLSVVLSKDARARAVQLPAWNEALGLPRPWDQQWSLRLQQIVANETDLLDYGDLFNGSPVVANKVAELKAEAMAEFRQVDDMGGAVAAVESGYMKQRLVESNAARLAAIESGEQIVVGVNAFTETAPSPLTASDDTGFLVVDPAAEAAEVKALQAWRTARDGAAVDAALAELRAAASEGRNIMDASIAAAHAGATTGEWGQTLRDVFGEYRAPTGIGAGIGGGAGGGAREALAEVRAEAEKVAKKIGAPIKMLVGKPGLDGHSNGAEQIAVAARDAGFEVVYEGIRSTPRQIAEAALEEGVHVVGLSILSGSHGPLVGEVLADLSELGLGKLPVVVGGIIPPDDAEALKAQGVARIYTPKDYQLAAIMADIVDVVGGAT